MSSSHRGIPSTHFAMAPVTGSGQTSECGPGSLSTIGEGPVLEDAPVESRGLDACRGGALVGGEDILGQDWLHSPKGCSRQGRVRADSTKH